MDKYKLERLKINYDVWKSVFDDSVLNPRPEKSCINILENLKHAKQEYANGLLEMSQKEGARE